MTARRRARPAPPPHLAHDRPGPLALDLIGALGLVLLALLAWAAAIGLVNLALAGLTLIWRLLAG